MTKVYEIVIKKGGVSPSPYVIASELFLKFKNIPFETIPLTYLEVSPIIKKLTNDEWKLVPTIQFDNGDVVFDSPKIADYLDEHYPEPKLKRDSPEVKQVADNYLSNAARLVFKLLILDLYNGIDGDDKVYFRESREKLFGITLEEFAKDPEANLQAYYKESEELADALKKSPFLEGDEPAFHDFFIAGFFHSAKTVSPKTYVKAVYEHPRPEIRAWLERLDALFDGYLANRKALSL